MNIKTIKKFHIIKELLLCLPKHLEITYPLNGDRGLNTLTVECIIENVNHYLLGSFTLDNQSAVCWNNIYKQLLIIKNNKH